MKDLQAGDKWAAQSTEGTGMDRELWVSWPTCSKGVSTEEAAETGAQKQRAGAESQGSALQDQTEDRTLQRKLFVDPLLV